MPNLAELQAHLLHTFEPFDYVVMCLCLLSLLFARFITRRYAPNLTDAKLQQRARLLRLIATLFLLGYGVPLILQKEVAQQMSSTGLTVFLAWCALHVIHTWVLEQYGREKEIDGQPVRSETLTSQTINLVFSVVVVAVVILTLLNIWDLRDWLQTTSVIGGLLIAVFASKDYWLGDTISGMVLLRQDKLQPGAVVQVKALGLLGVVKQITLTQSTLRDLVHKHDVILTNTLLRAQAIEVLSSATDAGLPDFVEFKLGYGVPPAEGQAFFSEVWEAACAENTSINDAVKPRVTIVATEDHGVRWRLTYTLSNAFNMLAVRHSMQQIAYRMSLEQGIALNTPLTHEVAVTSAPHGA